MARKLRLQYEGAVYHVINRGNYRRDVFETADKAKAFEECLFEAGARMGWKLHAYVLMRNHYHLALETPQPNLVEGMHWLQSTFATRFNRFRQERGHLFQGRYQALVVEPGDALRRVVDYIHLNPVRAGLVPVEQLVDFRWSSLRRFVRGGRPECLCADWRSEDNAEAWSRYCGALEDLAGDQAAQTEQGFGEMSRGWAIGTAGWRKAVAQDHRQLALTPGLPQKELKELKQAEWERVLAELLIQVGKTRKDAAEDWKSADWKVSIAEAMRRNTTATNRWIAAELHMGAANSVSQYLGWVRARKLKIRILKA
jgi:putative transposase